MDYSITGLLYDILFAVVLILTAVYGWKRGFLSSLMLLAGGVVGIFGAVWAAQTFGPVLYDHYVGAAIAEKVSAALAENGGDVANAVQALTFLPETIRDALLGTMSEITGEATPHVVEVLEPIVLPLIQVILFLVVCVVIRWLFRALAWAMRGCNAIPLVGSLNRLLGLILGVVSGALNCWLLSLGLWLLSMLTSGQVEFLRSAVLGQSAIYSLLSGLNPFTVYY